MLELECKWCMLYEYDECQGNGLDDGRSCRVEMKFNAILTCSTRRDRRSLTQRHIHRHYIGIL